MADWRLTKTRLLAGIWEGILSGGPAGATPPELVADYRGRRLEGLTVTEGPDGAVVRLALPAEVIADGIQTILITRSDTGAQLESVALIAGEALAADIRTEVELLRAELDMLKRAFRRHCVETAA